MEDKLIQSALVFGKEISPDHPLYAALAQVKDDALGEIESIKSVSHDDAKPYARAINGILDSHLKGIAPFPMSYLEMIPIARQLDEMFPRYLDEGHTKINYMGTSSFSHGVAERVLMCYCTREQESSDHDPTQFYHTMMLGKDADPETRKALRQHGGMVYLVKFGRMFLNAQSQTLAHIGRMMVEDPPIAQELGFNTPRTLDNWTEAYLSGLVLIGKKQYDIFHME